MARKHYARHGAIGIWQRETVGLACALDTSKLTQYDTTHLGGSHILIISKQSNNWKPMMQTYKPLSIMRAILIQTTVLILLFKSLITLILM